MRGIFASCALAAVLLAVALAAPHDHHEPHTHHGPHTHRGSGHNHHSHSDSVCCNKLSPANADFAFALYKSLNAKTDAGKNIFYSPLGLSAALSMLSTGAKDTTHSQLFSTLGYSSFTQDEVNEAYKHIFEMLNHSQQEQQLTVGNSAAVRIGFSPVEKFLKDVEEFYSGEILKIDFSKNAESVVEINKRIAEKTNDKIKDMVKELDPDMAMVLINHVYFRGQWEKPFEAEHTHKANFTVDATTTVEVDMMKKSGRFDLYEDEQNHTTVLLLPYKGNTSMMIVLPEEGKMSEVEGFICKEHIKHWHDLLFKTNVEVSMPKFSISAEASLADTLKEMGITDAFADNADFSGMSDNVNLKVSKVSHKAVLSVDEAGTEAAGTTTIEVMPMSMPSVVKLDRPFMLFIMEHSTKSILFMGKINNPTAV